MMQKHHAAPKHWRSMMKPLPSLVTTSYVFAEVVTYFNSRGYHGKAVEFVIMKRLRIDTSFDFDQRLKYLRLRQQKKSPAAV